MTDMQLHISGRLNVDVYSYGSIIDLFTIPIDARLSGHRCRLDEIVQRKIPESFVVDFAAKYVGHKLILAMKPFIGERLCILDVVLIEVAPGSDSTFVLADILSVGEVEKYRGIPCTFSHLLNMKLTK